MIDRVRSIAICKNSNKKKGLMSSVRLNQPLILPYNTPYDGYCTGCCDSDRVAPANAGWHRAILRAFRQPCYSFESSNHFLLGGTMSVSFQKEYVPALERGAVQNRVLRNTYWLLALSMIPTMLGAVGA